MSTPIPLVTDILGFHRDLGREDLPPRFVWGLVDWIPDLGAMVGKRGGWTRFSDDVSVVSTGATYVAVVNYAEFTAGTKLVYITDNSKLGWLNLTTGVATNVGTVSVPVTAPVLHRNKLIIPSPNGTTAVTYYDGVSTVGNLAGSPPAGKFVCVYRDRTVLANYSGSERVVRWSDPGDPTVWNSLSFWNTSHDLTGIWPLRNAILCFSTGFCERLRGTTPPPGTDMALEPVFDHGCIDARSLAGYGDQVIFANIEGVFLTDGAIAVDLTAQGGISTYWRDTLSTYTSSWSLAGGLFNNTYFLSIMNGATFVACLRCHLPTRTWSTLTNVKSLSFAHVVGAAEKLYFADRGAKYVNEGSSFFSPAAANKNDGDGTAVTPVLETAYDTRAAGARGRIASSSSIKNWGFAFGDYDLRDAATDNPTLQVAYIRSPEATSYTNAGGTIAETTKITRWKRPLNIAAPGVALKIAQANASASSRLFSIEAVRQSRELSRIT